MKVEVAPLGDVLRMRREVAGDVLDVAFDFPTEVGGGTNVHSYRSKT